jgi:hypothetical protein
VQVVVPTPVDEPQQGDPAWQGRQLVAVLVETPGHWVTFVKVAGVWYSVDAVIAVSDPFANQSPQSVIHLLAFR